MSSLELLLIVKDLRNCFHARLAASKTTPDPSVIGLDEESAGLLQTFVTQAHNNASVNSC